MCSSTITNNFLIFNNIKFSCSFFLYRLFFISPICSKSYSLYSLTCDKWSSCILELRYNLFPLLTSISEKFNIKCGIINQLLILRERGEAGWAGLMEVWGPSFIYKVFRSFRIPNELFSVYPSPSCLFSFYKPSPIFVCPSPPSKFHFCPSPLLYHKMIVIPILPSPPPNLIKNP